MITVVVLCAIMGLQSIASSVNAKIAEKVAKQFLTYKVKTDITDINLVLTGQNNSYYLFSTTNQWIIVSGDTDLYPVLGFSTESSISISEIPPAMKSYLTARKTQLREIRNERVSNIENQNAWISFLAGKYYASRADDMEPLIQTLWNQDYPYNMFCPEYSTGSGGHVYAGCVATAMAQIMKFYNYPETGRFSKTYFWGQDIEVNFEDGNYQWDEMTNSINTNSKEAIAKLMFHCGVAVDMSYSPDGSSASIQASAFALKQYFKYKSGLEFVDKGIMEDSDWKFLLKEDLDKGHPILYRGTSDSGGGHAFVCDAYQDTSYFHFNFGWSGYGNGFFHLGDNGFSWSQGAVINIMPYWGEYCSSSIYSQNNWSFGDGSGPNYCWNDTDCEWLIQPENAEQVKLSFTSFETLDGDELYIYDGNSSDASLIGEYSGSNVPSDIISSGNSLLLKFVTDGEGQSLGWDAKYESIQTGINDFAAEGFALYPNPVKDVLYVQMLDDSEAIVEIFNSFGQLVKQISSNAIRENISVEDLNSGVYILKVQQGETISQQRFVINK